VYTVRYGHRFCIICVNIVIQLVKDHTDFKFPNTGILGLQPDDGSDVCQRFLALVSCGMSCVMSCGMCHVSCGMSCVMWDVSCVMRDVSCGMSCVMWNVMCHVGCVMWDVMWDVSCGMSCGMSCGICHVSCGMCRVGWVMWDVSCGMCHVSCGMCHVSWDGKFPRTRTSSKCLKRLIASGVNLKHAKGTYSCKGDSVHKK
jgi:hypothetical protein